MENPHANAPKQWLAAYLYYAEPWEAFLTKGVMPFVQQVLDAGWAQQWFYIRYWEQGPHIRLRFYGTPAQMEPIKPALEKHFNAYYKQHPSEREESEWVKNLPPERQWFPNNSIQYIEYEPETDRYGGPVGLLISERHFQDSSVAIMGVTAESDEWDYTRALGAAIQMHLGFAYGTGMNRHEATRFFVRTFQGWLPRAYYFWEKDVPQEEYQRRRTETLKAFDENWQKQKGTILPYVKMVWEALEQDQEFEQTWLNDWVQGVARTTAQLAAEQEKGTIIWPPYKMQNEEPEPQIAPERQERWKIYDSYIHMINNRLGVQNRDEGYLGYLIKESFIQMEQEEPAQ